MNQDPPFPHPHPQDLHPDQLVQLPPAGGVRGKHLDHRPLLHSLQVKINNGPVCHPISKVASIANYLPFNVTLSRSDPMRSLFDICTKNIVPRFNLDFLYTTITMGVDPGYVKENFYDKVDFHNHLV